MTIRILTSRVPLWTQMSCEGYDDKGQPVRTYCHGKPVRVPYGCHATIIEGTVDRPLVQAFYPSMTPCYGYLMPGDFEVVGEASPRLECTCAKRDYGLCPNCNTAGS